MQGTATSCRPPTCPAARPPHVLFGNTFIDPAKPSARILSPLMLVAIQRFCLPPSVHAIVRPGSRSPRACGSCSASACLPSARSSPGYRGPCRDGARWARRGAAGHDRALQTGAALPPGQHDLAWLRLLPRLDQEDEAVRRRERRARERLHLRLERAWLEHRCSVVDEGLLVAALHERVVDPVARGTRDEVAGPGRRGQSTRSRKASRRAYEAPGRARGGGGRRQCRTIGAIASIRAWSNLAQEPGGGRRELSEIIHRPYQGIRSHETLDRFPMWDQGGVAPIDANSCTFLRRWTRRRLDRNHNLSKLRKIRGRGAPLDGPRHARSDQQD